MALKLVLFLFHKMVNTLSFLSNYDPVTCLLLSYLFFITYEQNVILFSL